jgi:hypothetical protein
MMGGSELRNGLRLYWENACERWLIGAEERSYGRRGGTLSSSCYVVRDRLAGGAEGPRLPRSVGGLPRRHAVGGMLLARPRGMKRTHFRTLVPAYR